MGVSKIAIIAGALVGAASTAVAGAVLLSNAPTPSEVTITTIPLSGGADETQAELSGLAWLGDELVLLPQFPGRFPTDEAPASVFAIDRRAIEAFLDRGDGSGLRPRRIAFDSGGTDALEGFEGFEAIAFRDGEVFLTVEIETETSTTGYLVKGRLDAHRTRITLDPGSPVALPAQSPIDNLAYEAMVLRNDRVITFFEANGACNAEPVAQVFDTRLRRQPPLSIDKLEYRLTDATELDEHDRFWVSNFFFAGDQWEIGACPLTARFGAGRTHQAGRTVERIVELEIDGDSIHPTGRAPIQLELLGEDHGRNWEGIARLGTRGLLLVTDEHPRSMLAFVALE